MADSLKIAEEEVEIDGLDTDEAEIDISEEKRNIHTKSSDPEIESLYGKWKKGKLNLQANFQRQYVWERKKASALIESVLLSVPLPIVYIAEEKDGKESVIDGQQRLTSLFSFIDGKFPNDEKFNLSGLKVFKELNRKSFKDLDEKLQDKIRYYEIRVVTILADSDENIKFEIFERLNVGAVQLQDMELRNCIYRGSYMELLKELASNTDFRNLTFKTPDKRMRDVELVLRFASFYHSTYLKYQAPMKNFFNTDMEKYRNVSTKEGEELKTNFKNGIQIVKTIFGDKAFKRYYAGVEGDPDGYWEPKKFNASLFDVFMGVFCGIEKNRAVKASDSLREALIDLMTSNQEFIDAITLSTSSPDKVKKRFDLVRSVVDKILINFEKQPRLFTLKFKEQLFKSDPTCRICSQRIQLLDDAAVDHIEEYWRGGQTIPENARLTHRYCNNARSKKLLP